MLLWCNIFLKQTVFCLFHSTVYSKIEFVLLVRQILQYFYGILKTEPFGRGSEEDCQMQDQKEGILLCAIRKD